MRVSSKDLAHGLFFAVLVDVFIEIFLHKLIDAALREFAGTNNVIGDKANIFNLLLF